MILLATCAVEVHTFWPRTTIAARNLLGEGLDARRVEAGVGLGEAEGALVLPGDQAGHPARFLLGRAFHDDRMRPEQIDVHGRGRRHAAAVAGDLVHHDGRLGDAEPGAAVLLRHGDAEPAGLGHRAVELAREDAVLVARQPIVVAEPGHDGAHALADRLTLVLRSARALASLIASPFRSRRASSAPPSDGECRPSCRRCRACRRRDWPRRLRRCAAHARSRLRTACKQGLMIATWSGWIADAPEKAVATRAAAIALEALEVAKVGVDRVDRRHLGRRSREQALRARELIGERPAAVGSPCCRSRRARRREVLGAPGQRDEARMGGRGGSRSVNIAFGVSVATTASFTEPSGMPALVSNASR